MSAQGSSAASRRGLAGRVIGDRYRVARMVSAGSRTLIADAEDVEVGRPVTVKLVRPEIAEAPEFRRKFVATMRAMAKLSHPNIAAVHDWGEEQIGRRTTVYAVVEHLGGGSLRDLFDRGRRLEPSQALVVGLEVCRGLDFAHRKHLVHGELTPSKLVFGDDRRLRIVDFGLARLLGAEDWREPSSVATHVARYCSPEQALGQPIAGTADVYALALILVEAVSGEVPFAARSTVATLSARVGRLMPVSADLGPLAAVLERAGRPDPADRSTAAELGRSLVRAAEKLPRPAPIPLLVSSTFQDDPNRLRRPSDPTGGIDRPPPEPVVALVPLVAGPPAPDPDEPSEPTVAATAEERAAGASIGDAAAAAAGAAAAGGVDAGVGAGVDAGPSSGGVGGDPAPPGSSVEDPPVDHSDVASPDATADDDVPLDVVPLDLVPLDAPPLDPVPADPVPADPVPVDHGPVDPPLDDASLPDVAPVEPVPDDAAPGDPAPIQAAPDDDPLADPPAPDPPPSDPPAPDPPPSDPPPPDPPTPAPAPPDALPPDPPPPDPPLADPMPVVTRSGTAAATPRVSPPDPAGHPGARTDEGAPGAASEDGAETGADAMRDELAALARPPIDVGALPDAVAPMVKVEEPAASPAPVAVVTSPQPPATGPTDPAVDTSPASPSPDSPDAGPRRRWWVPWIVALAVVAALAGLAFLALQLFEVPKHPVPQLVGADEATARAEIADFQWDVEVRHERSDEHPTPGEIIRTAPRAGSELAEDEPFLIVVSDGEEFRVLEDLAGLSVADAETKLAEQRLVALAPVEQPDEEVPAGSIISWSVPTDPGLGVGGEVLPETEVELVVSTGPAPRTIPTLVGTTVEQATAALDAIQLGVTVAEPVFSDDIPTGSVVSADPPDGTAGIARGTSVTITRSKGVDLVTSPALAGLTLDQAREALLAAGMQLGSVLGNTQGTILEARVAGELLTPGTQFKRGTAVDVALF